jgi:molybdenum cofactor cytidylyltransferase
MGNGRLKQLLPLGGRPVLRWSLDALADAAIRQVVVVLSPGVDVAAALAGTGVRQAVNAVAGSDMAASVRAGLAALGHGASGALIFPADHPFVSADTIRELAALHRKRPEAVLIPCHGGRRGHPALFPAALLRLVGCGSTLREVRDAHADLVQEIAVADPGVVFDMDTWDDYREARSLAGQDPAGRARACDGARR